MKKFKRIISIVLVAVMCLALNVTAFAAEITSNSSVSSDTEVVVGQEDEIMPLGTGSISGYAYKRLTSTDRAIIVPLSASGFGGMGVTIRVSSSYQGKVDCVGRVVSYTPLMWVDGIDGQVSTNGETYFKGNHLGGDGLEFVIALDVPSGVEMDVWIWVYG